MMGKRRQEELRGSEHNILDDEKLCVQDKDVE
jgi:hypothetical protein